MTGKPITPIIEGFALARVEITNYSPQSSEEDASLRSWLHTASFASSVARPVRYVTQKSPEIAGILKPSRLEAGGAT
jgi:hypothetical protein